MSDTALLAFMRKAKDTWRQLSSSSSFIDNVHVVLGNESCDLDSVVSALCLGLLVHSTGNLVVPVLNIPREDFPLRTEVVYLLHKSGIPADLLVFRDEIDLAALRAAGRLKLSLVDHHALPDADRPLYAALVTVVDHRPRDAAAAAAFPANCETVIRPVGSCASLVAERVLGAAPHLLDHQVSDLIRGTVLLDTACFSAEADRTTPLDVSVVEACEERGGTAKDSRIATFGEMVTARKDVSSLSSFQLLHKDMKVVLGVPLPGMPILVRDFLRRPDASSALTDFCAKFTSEAAVVVGMSFGGDGSTLQRDLAVFCAGAGADSAKVLEAALQSEVSLQLVQIPCDVPGVTLFDQRNTKASRKQILPVVQRVLSQQR